MLLFLTFVDGSGPVGLDICKYCDANWAILFQCNTTICIDLYYIKYTCVYMFRCKMHYQTQILWCKLGVCAPPLIIPCRIVVFYSRLYSTIIYSTLLYSTMLSYTILYCTILHYTTIICYTIPYHTILHYTAYMPMAVVASVPPRLV